MIVSSLLAMSDGPHCKIQEGSRRFKKVQEGSRRFKKVQEGLRRFKKVHKCSIMSKEKGIQKF